MLTQLTWCYSHEGITRPTVEGIDKGSMNTGQVESRGNRPTSKPTHDIDASDDEAEGLGLLDGYTADNSAVEQPGKDDYNPTADIRIANFASS